MGILSRSMIVLFTVLSFSGHAYGDAMCNHADVDKLDSYLKNGLNMEKAGRTLEALLFFRAADSFCGNRVEARKGLQRIGAGMGAAAEKNGRFFSGKSILAMVPDEDCRRWARHILISPNPYEPSVPGLCVASSGGMRVEIESSAGAYDWYEATYNYRESDSLVMRSVKSGLSDLGAADRAFRHFKSRERLNSPGYSIDPAHLALLRGTSSSNLDSILSKEERSYAGTRNCRESLANLESALKWAALLGESGKARVYSRATRRAEEALKRTSVNDLYDAIEFYSFAGEGEPVAKVAERADELGYAAMKENEPEKALDFFNLSGNEQLIKKAESLAEKVRKARSKGKKSDDPARSL
ncbi:MAG: hypothetical protein HS130_10470 [Deltaproteobacteria bacterium]|nr:hypothetical protein [Deltaproteobacteria bacterium]MCL4873735.1 hypothetical protein [bacterium]